jgi:two-component sensor histidine kinase
VAIEWREVGGPPVSAPSREGFGMRLLGAALQTVGGRVEPVFAPDGFVARIEWRRADGHRSKLTPCASGNARP